MIAIQPKSRQLLGVNQQSYQALKASMSLNLRRQLLIAVCDDVRMQNQLATQLENDLEQSDRTLASIPVSNGTHLAAADPESSVNSLRLERLMFDPEEGNLPQQVAHWVRHTMLSEGSLPKLQVLGIEQMIHQPAITQNYFLRSLEKIEALLPRLNTSLLIWVPWPWLRTIQQSSPTFWNWRNGVFEFVSDPTPTPLSREGLGRDGLRLEFPTHAPNSQRPEGPSESNQSFSTQNGTAQNGTAQSGAASSTEAIDHSPRPSINNEPNGEPSVNGKASVNGEPSVNASVTEGLYGESSAEGLRDSSGRPCHRPLDIPLAPPNGEFPTPHIAEDEATPSKRIARERLVGIPGNTTFPTILPKSPESGLLTESSEAESSEAKILGAESSQAEISEAEILEDLAESAVLTEIFEDISQTAVSTKVTDNVSGSAVLTDIPSQISAEVSAEMLDAESALDPRDLSQSLAQEIQVNPTRLVAPLALADLNSVSEDTVEDDARDIGIEALLSSIGTDDLENDAQETNVARLLEAEIDSIIDLGEVPVELLDDGFEEQLADDLVNQFTNHPAQTAEQAQTTETSSKETIARAPEEAPEEVIEVVKEEVVEEEAVAETALAETLPSPSQEKAARSSKKTLDDREGLPELADDLLDDDSFQDIFSLGGLHSIVSRGINVARLAKSAEPERTAALDAIANDITQAHITRTDLTQTDDWIDDTLADVDLSETEFASLDWDDFASEANEVETFAITPHPPQANDSDIDLQKVDPQRAAEYFATGLAYRARIESGERSLAVINPAIEAYESGLRCMSEPHADWITGLNDLGTLYWLKAQQQENTQQAVVFMTRSIDLYKEALSKIQASQADAVDELQPGIIGQLYSNMGAVYTVLATCENPMLYLKEAAETYNQALPLVSLENHPEEYATLQNSLGSVFWKLSHYDSATAYLHQAIKAYSEALLGYQPQQRPLDYAAVQNNLGITYWSLAKQERPEFLLKHAIAAYRDALNYRTPDVDPSACAISYNNLALAYWDLAKHTQSDIAQKGRYQKNAVTAFEAALNISKLSGALNAMDSAAIYHCLGDVHAQMIETAPSRADVAISLQKSLYSYIKAIEGLPTDAPAYPGRFTAVVANLKLHYEKLGLEGQQSALNRVPPALLPQVMMAL